MSTLLSRRPWRAVVAAAAMMLALIAGACGSDSPKSVGTPRLAGTPIPPVVRPSATPPTCDVEGSGEVPSSFPQEFPIPDGFVVTSVQTDPYLLVDGRVAVPSDAAAGSAESTVSREIIDAIFRTWTVSQHPRTEGLKYDFEQDDGRSGTVYIRNVRLCPQHADLTYEFTWITPAAGSSDGN